ncbi:MAG: cupin domain-containing protein [Pigmentiphaga sp.]|uniref:cupin domain-containing protein n=1 Tax=Pigmentiphaga sp. TaxID=1977564 RepID=UPI0029AFD49D|nr:cupin domain-containing protein [Pigmentiphaga sp.]MDX3907629.1 cupin domain-containing protein [Pigmentiphaga sp.]
MTKTLKPVLAFDDAQSLDELHAMLDGVRMKNGWAKPTPSLYPEPKRPFIPAHWRYVDARAALHTAGRLVGTDRAERRNLIMANPVPGNDYGTTRTIVGAYQMVKAGEFARSHRHTPNAMRLILEGSPEAYTIVDGKRIPMLPGDVLLTPNWCYHGHHNQSRQDAYWIDFLDVPLAEYLGPIFFEIHPDTLEQGNEVEPLSSMRFAYSEYSVSLAAVQDAAPGIKCMELGPPRLATFDRVVVRLIAGAQWERPRTTINQIYVVVQGSGTTTSGEYSFQWNPGDMIAIPSWHDHRVHASSDAVLLRVSDAPLMRMLGWERTATTTR